MQSGQLPWAPDLWGAWRHQVHWWPLVQFKDPIKVSHWPYTPICHATVILLQSMHIGSNSYHKDITAWAREHFVKLPTDSLKDVILSIWEAGKIFIRQKPSGESLSTGLSVRCGRSNKGQLIGLSPSVSIKRWLTKSVGHFQFLSPLLCL